MKKILVILSLLSSFVFADFIGFGVGGGVYSHSMDGSVTYNSVTKSFDSDRSTEPYFWGYIEHPVPLIPNIKARYMKITEGDVTLNQLDATLYYEILDNIVSADIGINLKYIDFGLNNDTASLYLPMYYIGAKFSPPFIDAQIIAELSGLNYSGSSIKDLVIALHYDLSGFMGFDTGLEIGYKSQTIEIDDIANVDADIEISGMFTSVYFNF